jgi:hypothetical protein
LISSHKKHSQPFENGQDLLLNHSSAFLIAGWILFLVPIVGLAGFVGRKGKQPLTFVFMFNGGYEEALASRKFFDAIIESTNKWD